MSPAETENLAREMYYRVARRAVERGEAKPEEVTAWEFVEQEAKDEAAAIVTDVLELAKG